MTESFHPYINTLHKDIIERSLEEQTNIIFYGKSGLGKYYQSIQLIKKYSPTNLKYNKKMFIEDEDYYIKISDIHFEIDMSSLGCNYKTLFDKIQKQIKNSMESTNIKRGIIICKNFHNINKDLIHNFKNIMLSNCVYILNTEHICFFPNELIDRFYIIPLKKIKTVHTKQKSKFYTDNLKMLEYKLKEPVHESSYFEKKHTNIIINYLENEKIQFHELREYIYNLLTYQCNIDECIWILLKHYISVIDSDIITEVYNFLKCFNNNYRPIFHIERIILYIFKKSRQNIKK